MTRAAVLFLALLVACKDDSEATGVMLEIGAPSEVRESARELYIAVRSGPAADDLVERGLESVRVTEWPAEVLILASNKRRAFWRAYVSAHSDDDNGSASAQVEGAFSVGEIPTVRVELVPLEYGDPPDAGARSSSPSSSDAATAEREAGGAVATDAGADTSVTAVAPSAEGGARFDAGRDAREQVAETGVPDPRDASAPSPVLDASGGSLCPMAYPSNTECQRCTCMRCAAQIASCTASRDAAKNAECLAVRSCMEANHCTGQGCYCGGTTALACLTPAGPCLTEIETAAGGMGLTAVQNASADPENPLARSVAVGECQLMNCRSECRL